MVWKGGRSKRVLHTSLHVRPSLSSSEERYPQTSTRGAPASTDTCTPPHWHASSPVPIHSGRDKRLHRSSNYKVTADCTFHTQQSRTRIASPLTYISREIKSKRRQNKRGKYFADVTETATSSNACVSKAPTLRGENKT